MKENNSNLVIENLHKNLVRRMSALLWKSS